MILSNKSVQKKNLIILRVGENKSFFRFVGKEEKHQKTPTHQEKECSTTNSSSIFSMKKNFVFYCKIIKIDRNAMF